MLDAFTSSMCVEAWGRISFARALVEVSSDTDLKKVVTMAVPNEDGTSYTQNLNFTGTNKSGVDLATKSQVGTNAIKANGTSTSNSFDALNNINTRDDSGVSSSMGTQEEEQEAGHAAVSKHKSSKWNEEFESDDEVDEVIFPEGDKFSDKFDIQLKGRVRK
ncbi:hypothetical protein Tco_0581623 [Tanacetum coccineum]